MGRESQKAWFPTVSGSTSAELRERQRQADVAALAADDLAFCGGFGLIHFGGGMDPPERHQSDGDSEPPGAGVVWISGRVYPSVWTLMMDPLDRLDQRLAAVVWREVASAAAIERRPDEVLEGRGGVILEVILGDQGRPRRHYGRLRKRQELKPAAVEGDLPTGHRIKLDL